MLFKTFLQQALSVITDSRYFGQQDYFGECSEAVINDNVVTVYELLEEMLDNGFPLATESNVLKELIRPPTMLRSVVNTLTGKNKVALSPALKANLNKLKFLRSCLCFACFSGSSNVGEKLPTGQLSNIPWRRAGVKYANNEAYFDVIEEIDAIVDKSGTN